MKFKNQNQNPCGIQIALRKNDLYWKNRLTETTQNQKANKSKWGKGKHEGL